MRKFGPAALLLGYLGCTVGSLWTAWTLFDRGDTALSVLSLIFPPANLALPFSISLAAGVLALLAASLLVAGHELSAEDGHGRLLAYRKSRATAPTESDQTPVAA